MHMHVRHVQTKKVNDISEYTYMPWSIYVGESYLCTLKLIWGEGVFSKDR